MEAGTKRRRGTALEDAILGRRLGRADQTRLCRHDPGSRRAARGYKPAGVASSVAEPREARDGRAGAPPRA